MTELDSFEVRVHAAVRRYVADVSSELDPVAFAHVVATTKPRPGVGSFAWPWRSMSLVGWLLLLAALLVAIVGALGRLSAPYGLGRPGLIAFDTRDGHIVLTDADGSQPQDISSSAGGDYLPAWSPDGTRLAFWRASGDHCSLVVADPTGVVRTTIPTTVRGPSDPLTAWAGGAPGPLVWAPDSRRLAFAMKVGELSQIFVVGSDGTGLKRIGDPTIRAIDPSWSPDGLRIAFASVSEDYPNKADASSGVFVMNADGTKVQRISHMQGTSANGSFYAPQWQPAGDLIAFGADPSGVPHVFVTSSDGTGERDVSLEVGGVTFFDLNPIWSPDGRRLAFLRARTDGTGAQSVIVDADGTHVLMPAHPPLNGAPLTWAPDGTRVLGYTTDQSTSINTGAVDIDLSGGRPVRTISIQWVVPAAWQRLTP